MARFFIFMVRLYILIRKKSQGLRQFALKIQPREDLKFGSKFEIRFQTISIPNLKWSHDTIYCDKMRGKINKKCAPANSRIMKLETVGRFPVTTYGTSLGPRALVTSCVIFWLILFLGRVNELSIIQYCHMHL
jgi:hypothetical protein